MKQSLDNPSASENGAKGVSRSAHILGKFQLHAEPAEDERGYAKLVGATYPLSHALKAAGAQWLADKQSWIFQGPASFKAFVAGLEREVRGDAIGLAEEVADLFESDLQKGKVRRFLDLGPNAFENDELLELLLSYDSFLPDPSSASEKLFDEFGSLGAILASEPTKLTSLEDITPRLCCLIKAIQLTIERVMHEPIKENPILGSGDALLKFLRARMQHMKIEEMLVIYLDRRNRLIKIESAQGTVDHVPFYPRDVAARALSLYASAVIIAHNHPSGDVSPSRTDIEMTRKVETALQSLDINLYDHVIVGHESHLSFSAEGLL
jgi:DNA repair protein RadC